MAVKPPASVGNLLIVKYAPNQFLLSLDKMAGGQTRLAQGNRKRAGVVGFGFCLSSGLLRIPAGLPDPGSGVVLAAFGILELSAEALVSGAEVCAFPVWGNRCLGCVGTRGSVE